MRCPMLLVVFQFHSRCVQVFDLSQRSPVYFRTELTDGSLMVLKTNTKLYSDHDKQKRIMAAEEICACLAVPCNKSFVPWRKSHKRS